VAQLSSTNHRHISRRGCLTRFGSGVAYDDGYDSKLWQLCTRLGRMQTQTLANLGYHTWSMNTDMALQHVLVSREDIHVISILLDDPISVQLT